MASVKVAFTIAPGPAVAPFFGTNVTVGGAASTMNTARSAGTALPWMSSTVLPGTRTV